MKEWIVYENYVKSVKLWHLCKFWDVAVDEGLKKCESYVIPHSSIRYIRVIGGLAHELVKRGETTIEEELYVTQLSMSEGQGGKEHSVRL